MFVQRIQIFIKDLREQKILIPFDEQCIKDIQSHFAERSETDILNQSDINFLLEHFKERKKVIHDGNDDYTLSISKPNELWITLAKELEEFTKIPYLKILMQVTNITDPHDKSALNDTKNIVHFYLDDAGELRRKHSFCTYMVKNGYTLITRSEQKDSIVTLGELSRLKRCQENGADGEFSIGSDSYADFWSFMRIKPFSHLVTPEGQMPKELLPLLLDLIENYFELKRKGNHFNEFKKKATHFFNQFKQYEIADINFFYGQTANYKNGRVLLVDLFLEIFEANQFKLDEVMSALSKFLYLYNSVLKVKSKELQFFEKSLIEESLAKRKEQARYSYLACHQLLVSLFVTQFEFYRILGKPIELWDIEKSIPKELFPIYLILRPLTLQKQQQINYANLYEEVVTFATVAGKNRNWWISFSRFPETQKWLDDIKDLNLSEIDGCFYEPELILSVLSSFEISESNFKNEFLDSLIKICAQEQINEPVKKLKIAMLLWQFLSQINAGQRNALKMKLELNDTADVKVFKEKFINNCAIYINKRLNGLGYTLPPEKKSSFFVKEMDISDILFRSTEKPETVNKLLDLYFNKLPKAHLDKAIKEKIDDYLFQIWRPNIRSLQEENHINSVTRIRVDPLGSFT